MFQPDHYQDMYKRKFEEQGDQIEILVNQEWGFVSHLATGLVERELRIRIGVHGRVRVVAASHRGLELAERSLDSLDVAEGSWAGRLELTSSNGWHTRGDGALTWSGDAAVDLVVTLDTVSLDASGAATLTWSDG